MPKNSSATKFFTAKFKFTTKFKLWIFRKVRNLATIQISLFLPYKTPFFTKHALLLRQNGLQFKLLELRKMNLRFFYYFLLKYLKLTSYSAETDASKASIHCYPIPQDTLAFILTPFAWTFTTIDVNLSISVLRFFYSLYTTTLKSLLSETWPLHSLPVFLSFLIYPRNSTRELRAKWCNIVNQHSLLSCVCLT